MFPLGGLTRFASSARPPPTPIPSWTPLELVGDGLEGWWCFEYDQLTVGLDQLIAQVVDQSGFGRDALQLSSGLLRPEFDASTGRGAGAFDGSRVMVIDASFAAAITEDNYTLWCVFRSDDNSSSASWLDVGLGLALDIESGALQVRRVGSGLSSDGLTDNATHLVVVTRDAGLLHMYLDGVEVPLTTPSGSVVTPTGPSYLGALTGTAVFGATGLLYQAGGVSRVLPPTELATLRGYAQTYYSL